MAIFNTTTNYYLQSLANSNLYLNRYGTGNPANQQNVNGYAAAGTSDQRWKFISRGGSKYQVALEMGSYVYGLDYYWGSSNIYNCDINKLSGNDADSIVTVYEVPLSANARTYLKFMIKDRYLTLKSNNDVRWEVDHGTFAEDQLWRPVTTQTNIGGGAEGTSGTGNQRLVEKQTAPIQATGMITIRNVPDVLQSSGVESSCIMHKGSGFVDGTDFTDINFATYKNQIVKWLRTFVMNVYKTTQAKANAIPEKELLYYLYGESLDTTGNSWFHTGVDLNPTIDNANGAGRTIHSHRAGTVVKIDSGAGAVFIKDADAKHDVTHIFEHMTNISVYEGQPVSKGHPIGKQGNVGNPTPFSSHLHYEVRAGEADNLKGSYPTKLSILATLIPYYYMGL